MVARKNRLRSIPVAALAALLVGAVALFAQSPPRSAAPQAAADSSLAAASTPASGSPPAAAGGTSLRVTAATVWKPDAAALKAIEQRCEGGNPSSYVSCLVKEMRAHGASPEAVAFAQQLAANGGRGPGFAVDFTEGGRVAVAHILFPARLPPGDRPAQGWLLVNGSPGLIDVDDPSLLPGPIVDGDLILQEIRRSYSKAGIYGDERTTASPAMMVRSDGGQRFPITYSLRNGCRSCEEVGNAEVAFDFSADGKFQGATLLGMWMRRDMGTLVAVQAGRDFYLHLPSDHPAGYSWQLASPLDANLLKFVGKEYTEPGGQLGKDGVEKWTLHALARGRTILRFQNVQPGETNPPPNRKFFFAVTVQ